MSRCLFAVKSAKIQQPAKKITADSINKLSQFSDETFVLFTSDEIRRRFVTHLMRNLAHTNTVSFDYYAQISRYGGYTL